MYNIFTFYLIVTEKLIVDGPLNTQKIPDILRKAVWMLKVVHACK